MKSQNANAKEHVCFASVMTHDFCFIYYLVNLFCPQKIGRKGWGVVHEKCLCNKWSDTLLQFRLRLRQGALQSECFVCCFVQMICDCSYTLLEEEYLFSHGLCFV